MLTLLIYIIFIFLLFPIIVIFLITVFGISFLARFRRRSRAPKQKPKGTIEILPPEKPSDFDDSIDQTKGSRVGKDKFRKL